LANPRLRRDGRPLATAVERIAAQLLAETETGAALRQDAPLAGSFRPRARAHHAEFSMTRAQLEHIVRAAGRSPTNWKSWSWGASRSWHLPFPPPPLDVSREPTCARGTRRKKRFDFRSHRRDFAIRQHFRLLRAWSPSRILSVAKGWEGRLIRFQNENTAGDGALPSSARSGVFQAGRKSRERHRIRVAMLAHHLIERLGLEAKSRCCRSWAKGTGVANLEDRPREGRNHLTIRPLPVGTAVRLNSDRRFLHEADQRHRSHHDRTKHFTESYCRDETVG